MGDRGIVVMKRAYAESFYFERGERRTIPAHTEYAPGVYVHWAGEDIPALLKEAAPRMRGGDPSYAIARFCGVAHEHIPGALSLGIVLAPEQDTKGVVNWEAYSPGDAGIALVDVDTGVVTFHAGYLEQRQPSFTIELAKV